MLNSGGKKYRALRDNKKKYSNSPKKNNSERKKNSISLKIVTLVQSSLDCKENVEQLSHQCFERRVKICEPLNIEVKKPRMCDRPGDYSIWDGNTLYDLRTIFVREFSNFSL